MQKFHSGDLVNIDKAEATLRGRSHAGEDGIVIGSYVDQFGGKVGSEGPEYTVYVRWLGPCSWFPEGVLRLRAEHQEALLQKWKDELAADDAMKSDMDWIFSHGGEVLKKGYHASWEALAASFGLLKIWGRNGEGAVLYENREITLHLAKDFLVAGDKAGWLEFCRRVDFTRELSESDGEGWQAGLL